MKILLIAGARPNFMKIAPLMTAFKKKGNLKSVLVHTGQHYDEKMSTLFFEQLQIPKPDINLGVGSASHAIQTADIMKQFEPVCLNIKPDAVLVVGDVNSTIACGLVAKKIGCLLIHVEAGLRSFDRTMPEEINRVLTDTISDVLFVSEPAGVANLKKEGKPEADIHYVGNVMIDTLMFFKSKAEKSSLMAELNIHDREYCTMTLHRPSNVDDPVVLKRILNALDKIQLDIPIIFPVHPRTLRQIERFNLTEIIQGMKGIKLISPLGYFDFLKLNAHTRCVFTDSGGLQEETTALGVPCITLRDNTERPITCEIGTNQLVGTVPEKIHAAWERVISGKLDASGIPDLWDGHTADRIADVLIQYGQ